MSAEQVTQIPRCAECGEVWLPADEERWRADLDTDDELVPVGVFSSLQVAPAAAGLKLG
jgi:hypothetical protein